MQDCFRAHPDIYGDELADPGPDDAEEPRITEAVDSAVTSVAEDVPVSTIPSAVPPPSSPISLSKSSENPQPSSSAPPTPSTLSNPADRHPAHTSDDDDDLKSQRAKTATEQVAKEPRDQGEGEADLVPKQWHDTRKLNDQ